jgi:hypothetical protein
MSGPKEVLKNILEAAGAKSPEKEGEKLKSRFHLERDEW